MSGNASETDDGADDDRVVSSSSQFEIEKIEKNPDSDFRFFAENELDDVFAAGEEVRETADAEFHQTIVGFIKRREEEINDTVRPFISSLILTNYSQPFYPSSKTPYVETQFLETTSTQSSSSIS